MKFEFSQQIFEKHSNTKFHKNPSNDSRVIPYKLDWRTDKTELLVGFEHLSNKPENGD
jgi:hypothetical protein